MHQFNDYHFSGNFTALPLHDLTAENLAASAIYCRRDFYKVSIVSGHATYHYSDQQYAVPTGKSAMVFTNRQMPYRWEIHSGKGQGYIAAFTDDFLPPYQKTFSIFESPAFFVIENTQPFTTLFEKMIAEQHSGYPNKQDLLFLYIQECIHEVLKTNPAPPATPANRIVTAFQHLLANQFPMVSPLQQIHLRTPQAFADELAVHPNYLNRALKTATGKTTTELIITRIMQEARALLIHSDWTIAQISDSLGYEEPTHFTKAFRKCNGKTPTAFRTEV
jgi:AraC-like DNA-binding protein